MKNESPFLIYGSKQTRAFCYIDDAVEGTVLAMENDISDGKIYHIGTEDEKSIDKLVKAAGLFFNYQGEYKDAPTYPGSTDRRCPDITKATNDLGYVPKVNLKYGLIKTLEWYHSFFKNNNQTFESSFEKPNIKNV